MGCGPRIPVRPSHLEEVIDIERWQSKAKARQVTPKGISDGHQSGTSSIDDEAIASASGSVEKFKAWQEARKSASLPKAVAVSRQVSVQTEQAQNSFREKRERERQEKIARDQEQLARLKRDVGKSNLAAAVPGVGSPRHWRFIYDGLF